MRPPCGAGACRRPRHATHVRTPALTLALTLLLFFCSSVAAESKPQLPLESHVVVGADGIARTRGAGRAHSDGLSITRSTPVVNTIAADAVVDDQAVRFSPPRVDLGRLETCSPNLFTVGIENRGRVSVRLDGADFTQDGFSMANDVRGIRLDPGDRFNLQFVFLPSDVAPSGVDAHLRVLTTSGLFVLPITSTEVALNAYGVSGIRASIATGVHFEQSLPFVNPFNETMRLTEIYVLDSFIDLEMRNGTTWIGPRWPRQNEASGIVKEIPGEYDKDYDYRRRADRGAWDMPARTTSPLVKVSLESQTPGVYLTYIHVAAGNRRLLLVPVHITVLKPGIHIEPKELDLGMLAEQHEDKAREVFFTLFNAGSNPIDILELKVLESNMVVSAQLRGSTTIPARSRAYDVLAVQLRVDKTNPGSECFASLLLKTSASSSALGHRKLRLYGKVLRGHLAFHLNETLVGVILPLANMFESSEDVLVGAEEDGALEIVEDQLVPHSRLVSMIISNASNGLLTGTSEIRHLRLWNRFDRPVELQRVWIPVVGSVDSDLQEVNVYKFNQGVAQAGAAWPNISLQISPIFPDNGNFFTARSYPLMIETNATLHRIQIYLYHNILNIQSTRGLHSYSVSGYYTSSGSESKEKKASRTCLSLPDGGLIPTAKPRIDGGKGSTDIQGVHLCRSLVFDLEMVASHKARTEVVRVTNGNPVPITLRIITIAESDDVDMNITAIVSLAQQTEYATRCSESSRRNQDKTTTSTATNVSFGDSFVLPPGCQVHFYIEVWAKESLGNFTIPVLSFTTPVEFVHLYARFRIVQGTVEPVTPAIVLPSMFPGRTEIIHLHYRNTFAHSVTPVTATLSSSNLKILSISDTMGPQRVERVLDLLFSPAADAKCSNALFLADCLLPLQPDATETDQTCEQLSDYGEFVDEHDLVALSRRDAFWKVARGVDHRSKVEAQVHLQTDILDDVAGVTIMAQLERPLVTTTTRMPISLINDSLKTFAKKEFCLTEVFGLSHVFVDVHNPSNISVRMELTIAEADQALFYFCEQEITTKESWGYSDSYHVSARGNEDTIALCLAKWKSTVTNAVTDQRAYQVEVGVPPFYFRRQIVRVLAGEETKLGPIYYLPSKVQELTTTVFVRNDLSHIEPIHLLARSGKGTLELSVDVSSIVSNSATARFNVHNPSPAIEQESNIGDIDFSGVLSFTITSNDPLTSYRQDAEILLSNTGPFGLTIHRVTIKADNQGSWISPTKRQKSSSTLNDFVVASKLLNVEVDGDDQKGGHFDPVVLPSGNTARLQVSFFSSCYSAMVASWLIVDTSDSIKLIRVEGTITPDVAFSCLRARVSPTLRYALRSAWMLAVAVVVSSVLYTLWVLARDAWKSDVFADEQHIWLPMNAESAYAEDAQCDESDAFTPLRKVDKSFQVESHTIASISSRLEKMERLSFTPPARVMTPAVVELLEKRHKGLCSNAHTQMSSLDTRSAREEQDQNRWVDGHTSTTCTVPSHSNDDESDLKAGDAKFEQGMTVMQKEAVNFTSTGDSGTPPRSLHATLAPTSLKQGDSRQDSDLSSDEDRFQYMEELHSSVSSSASTIVPAEVEVSSQLPTMLSSFNDGRLKPLVSNLTPSTPPKGMSPQNPEEPFDVFESLSARWRAQDWHEQMIDQSSSAFGRASGDDDWEGTLSFKALGSGMSTSNQRGEDSGSKGGLGAVQGGSGSFIGGTSPGFLLDGFSAFDPPLTSKAVPPTTSKAPPGFTPADAKPLEARAAFDRLRTGSSGNDSRSLASGSIASSSGDAFGGSTLFASSLPLFGPALPQAKEYFNPQRGVGRIGSGRSRALRTTDASLEPSA